MIADRTARIAREQKIMDDIFPDFGKATDDLMGAIHDAKRVIEDEYAKVRQRIVNSPYERLMLAGALVDMTTEEAAQLAREIDGPSFDDVLACIDALRGKVVALKSKTESHATAERPNVA